jgi:hypothetical protein
MKLFLPFAASLAILLTACPAFARCKDAQKTCEFAALCMQTNDAHAQKIRESARLNTAAGGDAIWSELARCAIGGLAWTPRDGSGDQARGYDDIASGCNATDYLATGKAGVQLFDGAKGACK